MAYILIKVNVNKSYRVKSCPMGCYTTTSTRSRDQALLLLFREPGYETKCEDTAFQGHFKKVRKCLLNIHTYSGFKPEKN